MADEEDMGPKGGKRNAIVTYEELAKIGEGVAVLNIKMDTVNAALEARSKQHDDHETRIRALELSLAAAMAAKGTVGQVFTGLIAMVGIVISVLAYLRP